MFKKKYGKNKEKHICYLMIVKQFRFHELQQFYYQHDQKLKMLQQFFYLNLNLFQLK